ncbi:MAG TPA: patatin-like phospholipase family protein, partial [Planctomycetaceae bacterium]|nr:patatin-like phospholipase family protein [Planctomycetaceae bacterium]
SAGPILSDKLKGVLFAVGFDIAKFKQILRAFCDANLHVASALLIWILEQFGGIVAQVDDALIPEHAARMIARLEQHNFDFDDLSLGEQITARFLLGRKLGRLTPWETGIPLNGIFIGFRLTDVEVEDQREKNKVRFTIVGSSRNPIHGSIRLLGLDAFDRLIQPLIEKQLEKMRVQSEALQQGEKSDHSQSIQSQIEELNTFDVATGIAEANAHALSVGEAAPHALVMKGGGIKGLAYVGALEILARKYEFNWFVGTSAGAITAILLGAGYTAGELTEILEVIRGHSTYLLKKNVPFSLASAMESACVWLASISPFAKAAPAVIIATLRI